jgi:hypothetical protein
LNPLSNYNSILEIIFALNAMTYLFSIEPQRRGELLSLFREFKKHAPRFDHTDKKSVTGYVILAHYGAAHLAVSIASLVFTVTSAGLMLWSAADPSIEVPTRWMVPAMIFMLTMVPLGSIWLTFVCKTQFQKYIAEISPSDQAPAP